jgi:hypothetical protein
MARYIDADKLIMSFEPYFNGEKTIGQIIDNAPTEDVRTVVRGKWITVKGGYTACNKCGAIGNSNYNGCPMCLADMRGRRING